MYFTLETPLTEALGAASAKSLEKALGMQTVGDLLTHYPRRYAKHGELTPMFNLPIGEQVTLFATVRSASVRKMKNRKGDLLEVVISDGNGDMRLTFFNQGWRINELKPGTRGMFAGKVSMFKDEVQFTHPAFELLDDEFDDMSEVEREAWANEPVPIYPATASMPTWKIRKFVAQVLPRLLPVPEPFDESFAKLHGLLPIREALDVVHQPVEMREIGDAQRTLRMQEALLLQMALLQQRAAVRALPATKREAGSLLERFDARLPWSLTPDQQSVGDEIRRDLEGEWPMNRLVQGEVGSGKTLVALRAMLQVAQSGGQSALIAPTEVLAAQHLRSLAKMLGPELAPELMPTLLTGQMPAADRRKAALRVAAGQARIVVGTHALLSESTTFADLGLVVVDEQHRFGVEQRETLRAKGTAPHALVLTATPIPRTVAMTVFGDLDVSTIRTMPKGRAGIESFVVPAQRPSWLDRTWVRASEEVRKGHQVFVVASAIDTEAKTVTEEGPVADDALVEDKRQLWGVVQAADLLRRHPAFEGTTIEVLHGKLPSDEKDRIMRSFAAGEIDVLVATTVIEVGVDVPNASTMIILDADRFGISQLHQLRGRIGRGEVPGLCLLVTDAPENTTAYTRVEAVSRTLDGFALAEVDLEIRGEGDVLGDRQSGSRSSLKLLRVVQDAYMIEEAREEGERILAEDPTLAAHQTLAAALEAQVSTTDRAALSKS